MRRGHHLREIVHCNGTVVTKHQVELVKVAVDQSMVCQPHYQLHAVTVDTGSVGQLTNVTPALTLVNVIGYYLHNIVTIYYVSN